MYRFVWLQGRPGTGKSEQIRAALSGCEHLYIKSGTITPLALYRSCFEHLNQPVVLDLDEMESMLKDTLGRRLLLALGETTEEKLLCWNSTSPFLGHTPSSFYTKSTLCIVAKEEPRHLAIRSRALKLLFEPTNEEIHRYAASWFWHQGIHDFVGAHLHRMHPLDLRWYLEAYADHLAERDWAGQLLELYALDRAEALVQDLQRDPGCPTRKDRERRFRESIRGPGGSRTTYGDIWRRLKKSHRLEADIVAPIEVRGKRPPRPGQDQEEPAAPTDEPPRQEFAQTITGTAPPAGAPARGRRGRRPFETDGSTTFDREPEEAEDEDEG
jgi:hypothetical protein